VLYFVRVNLQPAPNEVKQTNMIKTINLVPEMEGQPLEVKQPTEDELQEENEEKETPAEAPAVEKPADSGEGDPDKKPEEESEGESETETETSEEEAPEDETPEASDDAEKDREQKGLKAEEDKLTKQVRDNIVNLRSQRREQKQQITPPSSQPITPSQEDDIDPEVSKIVDKRVQKVLKDGGYVPKSEMDKENLFKGMKDADDNFLKSSPEYIHSSELRNEFDDILESAGEPKNIEDYQRKLEIAHSIIKKNHPDRFPVSAAGSSVQKRLDTASRGTGGKSKPSSSQGSSLSPDEKAQLRRGGFTEDEIKEFDKQLIKERQ